MGMARFSKIQISGTGLTIVSTMAPTLGLILPSWMRWGIFVAGLSMIAWPIAHTCYEHAKQRGRMTPLIGMIVCACGLIGFGTWYFWPTNGAIAPAPSAEEPAPKTPRPLLQISYIARDVQIKWPTTELLAENNEHKSPFAIIVRNIGDKKAFNIKLKFGMPISRDKILEIIKTSNIFPNMTTSQSGSLQITTDFLLNKPHKTIIPELEGENIRGAATLSEQNGDNALEAPYPGALENSLNLIILSRAFVRRREEIAPTQATLYRLLGLPDVTIEVSYDDINGAPFKDTATIRSGFRSIIPSEWTYEGDRLEKLYLEGGFGILSFEDRENPDDGFYNQAKRRGVILPP
jgi:hypothetical protein